MDPDEREINLYLKGCPGQFVSLAEITRRAGGKRRYRDDPNWAVPILLRMVEKGVLESDSTGHYRLKPRGKKEKQKRWVAPHIQKILEKSGKRFDHPIDVEADEDGPADGSNP